MVSKMKEEFDFRGTSKDGKVITFTGKIIQCKLNYSALEILIKPDIDGKMIILEVPKKKMTLKEIEGKLGYGIELIGQCD